MQAAIALTWSTLSARLKNYRFGSYACLLLAATLTTLLFLHSAWWLLAGLPAFILVGYRFVYHDQRLVFKWEDGVLAQWDKPDFVMGIFIQAIANHPNPLRKSLSSMVAMLPPDPDYQIPAKTRIRQARVLCWTRKAVQEIRLHQSISLTLGLSALPVLILGYLRTDIHPLLWVLPLFLLPLLQVGLAWGAWVTWKTRMGTLEAFSGDEWSDLVKEMERLDWKRIPAKLKRGFRTHGEKSV